MPPADILQEIGYKHVFGAADTTIKADIGSYAFHRTVDLFLVSSNKHEILLFICIAVEMNSTKLYIGSTLIWDVVQSRHYTT